MVLAATGAATLAAFAVSALRPARELSATAVSAAAPGGDHASSAQVAALVTAVIAAWLIVSLAQLVRVARRIGALRAMKHRAEPVELDFALPRGARTLASESGAPAAVGFLHPAILLPADTIGALDPKDARQIVLHEAAHLRRGDDLTGLVFQLCAALFWFNPFVHYIGKRLSLECEIACDEMVVEQTGDAARYAHLLYEMAETMTTRDRRLAWNGFAHRSGLVTRVQNLLLHPVARRRALSWPALAVLMGVLLSGAGLAAFNAPALAQPADDATTRVYQFVRSDSAMRNHHAMQSGQRVRAFGACKPARVRNDARMHNQFCEYEPTKFETWTLWKTHIKKKGSTP
jgi:beta-lactamase regulating signal transducer with metallopeptidase domain